MMLAVVGAAALAAGFFPETFDGLADHHKDAFPAAVKLLGFDHTADPMYTESDVKIHTRDGTQLYTRVFTPSNADGKMPVLYQQVPYAKEYHAVMVLPLYEAFLQANVSAVLLLQETRGRYNSTGSFDFFRNSAEDAEDTLTWATSQSWSNGVIIPWGISAMGIKSLLTTKTNLTIRTQLVGLASMSMREPVSYRDGALNLGIMQQILPFCNISFEEVAPMIADHEAPSEWWDGCTLKDVSRVSWPMIEWAAWYDIFAQSSLDVFEKYRNDGSSWYSNSHRLIIGALGHCGLRPSATMWRYNQTALTMASTLWVVESIAATTVFGQATNWASMGVALAKWSFLASKIPRIIMYVMGSPTAEANYLAGVDDWPKASNVSLYLTPTGGLQNSPPAPSSISYLVDPADPVPTLGGHLFEADLWTCGDVDQLPLSSRADVRTFTGEPLAEELAVTGRVWAELEVSSNATDTDFVARLVDVYPNGTRVLITDGVQRMRWRYGATSAQKMVPGQKYQIAVDLWSTCFVFAKGHAVGLNIQSSSDPSYRPNSNIDQHIDPSKLYPMTGTQNATALNTVHVGLSRLVLPVVEKSSLTPLGALPFPIPPPPPPPPAA
eukprot:Hpha_TRINITY_DN16035_c2_g1::TRINITY_DN16035_c2_g1_i1::g.120363::m.120363/K06978/K06978; uncharacterized protein